MAAPDVLVIARVKIPKPLWQWVRAQALLSNRPVQEVVQEALEHYKRLMESN